MGFLDSIETDLNDVWSNSLGIVWTALSGTQDPWANANATAQVAAESLPGTADANVAAYNNYLTSLGQSPSQFWQGLAGSLNPLNILGNFINGFGTGGSDIAPAVAPAGGPSTPGGAAVSGGPLPSWLVDILILGALLIVGLIALGFAFR